MTSAGHDYVMSLLRAAPLFTNVAGGALSQVARASRIIRLTRGQTLFSQGDTADTFYVMGPGHVALVLVSPDGRELVINDMRKGDCFGELGLLTNEPRSTSAVARQTTQLVTVPRPAFRSMLQEQPALMLSLLQTTAQRLANASDREGALAFLDAPARLARVLLQLDRLASADGYVTISQEELAQYVGLARQSVASLLGRWRRAGWVVTGRGKIVVLNKAALRRQSDSGRP